MARVKMLIFSLKNLKDAVTTLAKEKISTKSKNGTYNIEKIVRTQYSLITGRGDKARIEAGFISESRYGLP